MQIKRIFLEGERLTISNKYDSLRIHKKAAKKSINSWDNIR